MKEVLSPTLTEGSQDNFLGLDQFMENADEKRRNSLRNSSFFPAPEKPPLLLGKYESKGSLNYL